LIFNDATFVLDDNPLWERAGSGRRSDDGDQAVATAIPGSTTVNNPSFIHLASRTKHREARNSRNSLRQAFAAWVEFCMGPSLLL
ncbi:hypothetical protein, partial [Pseudomonas fluorescens]|uniref:hypothetical protein n=1 Tax=Pseudomonas fluorescens TaxID=294 RepID=UPI001A7EA8B7